MNKVNTGSKDCRTHFKTMLATGIALGALMSAPAFAQSAKPAAEAANPDDIIVTARRTDEKLQDVPVAVVAFGSQALAERRIGSEADLQVATPGLTVRSTTSSNQLNYAVRGQSVDSFSYSAPSVVAYFNNVPVGGTTATAFFDLESIQVLKGPQGTLFGRNATGGAVLYGAQKPTADFGGYLKAGFGNFSNREAEGAINIPITDGVAIRLSGKTQTRDGYQNDLVHNIKSGSLDYKVGRVSLLIKPQGSGFENVFVYQHGEYGGNSASLKVQNVNQVGQTYINPGTGLATPLNPNPLFGYIAGGYQPGVGLNNASQAVKNFLGVNPATGVGAKFNGINDFIAGYSNGKLGFYDVAPTQDGAHQAKQDFVSNTTSLSIGDNATIKNIFGYNKVFSVDNTDLTGSPFAQLVIGAYPNNSGAFPAYGPGGYNLGYSYGTKQWSDELQISGTALDGKLKYVAGLFISNQKDYTRIPFSMLGDISNCPAAPGSVPGLAIICGTGFFQAGYDFLQEDKSKAAYAQVSYAVTPQLNFTGGIRITKDDINITYPDKTVPFGLNAAYTVPGSKSASKPSWSVGFDYKPTDNLMVYFTHRGSWRTGGYNGTAPGIAVSSTDNGCPAGLGGAFGPAPNGLLGASGCIPEQFQAETTYDFELGAKFGGRLGDMPTVLNIAIYNQEISNVQRSPYIGLSAVAVNVPHARVQGLELDGSIRPAPWLQIGGAFTYTNAKYTKNVAVFQGQNFYFGPYADTPKYIGSAYFRAATDLPGDKGELALRGEFYSQSSFFYSNLANTTAPGTQLGGYGLLNARVEWNKIFGSEVHAAAYINNITNKQYYVGGISLSSVEGSNAALTGTPRMFGFELGVKF
jgi:iron complex outermembrane recepter protein